MYVNLMCVIIALYPQLYFIVYIFMLFINCQRQLY